MRCARVYVDMPLTPDSSIALPVDKAHYLRHVLRLKDGQSCILFNGLDSFDYTAELEVSAKQVIAHIQSVTAKQTDSAIDIMLLQAAGRPDHMDFIIQKGTELGVRSFLIFNSERTQTPYRQVRLAKKLRHWRSVAASACEQCNRNLLPGISFQTDLEQLLKQLETGQRIVLSFDGLPFTEVSLKPQMGKSFQLLIGPEGGLGEAEITLALEHGFASCLLGPRTLRMETAALAAVTLVQHHFGDLR